MEDKSFKIIFESEKLAFSILQSKQEIIALSKRQNDNRMALKQFKDVQDNSKKVWITIGSLLMKTTIEKAKSLLENDNDVISQQINKLRSELKVKAAQLRDIEYQEPIGTDQLKPLDNKELECLRQCWTRQ